MAETPPGKGGGVPAHKGKAARLAGKKGGRSRIVQIKRKVAGGQVNNQSYPAKGGDAGTSNKKKKDHTQKQEENVGPHQQGEE